MRRVGPGQPAFILAEIGSNHDRSLAQAKELIRVAADAGADAVKFQSIRFDDLWIEALESADKQTLYRSIELPEAWYPELALEAKQAGVVFLSAPTYWRSVALLEQVGVAAYKVASPQGLAFLPLVREIARQGKPVFLSTGYADYAQITRSVQCCLETGNDQIVLLHCVSKYPCSPHESNLRAMDTLNRMFGLPVGFSDHTLGFQVTLAAVALGAVAIEKHLTLDRCLPGPDHSFALEPHEFKAMVRQIREVESAIGDGRRLGPLPEEAAVIESITMRLVARSDLEVGALLGQEDLDFRRAPYGLSTDALPFLKGARLRQAAQGGMPLTWAMLEWEGH